MRAFVYILATAVWMATVGSAAARAQQEQQQQQPQDQGQQQTPANQGPAQPTAPIPAYRSPLAGAAANEEEETNTELTPDTRALTGVENFSLGIPTARTYWQPRFDFFTSEDSNPQEVTGPSGWGTWTSFSGGVDIHRDAGNSDLTVSYTGGGMIAENSDAPNGVIQELYLADKHVYRRWALLFFDQLSYLPQAGFGFNGLGGGALPVGGTQGAGNGFTPGQTVLTGQQQNLANAFDTEVDAYLTPQSSLTLVGGYSLLHYFANDFFNYGTATFRVGYNYQSGRKNTFGVAYTYNDVQYTDSDQTITSHTVQASYGRRVTGRLAFQIAAGPQVAMFQLPISAGAGGAETFGGGSTTQVYWAVNTNLQYKLERTAFAVSYSRGVAGGSGVLAGSVANTVYGAVTRQMSRTFSSGVTGGFSRNTGLAGVAGGPVNQTFNYFYVGANLAHPVGRTLAFTATYQLQYQTANAALCTGPGCGMSVVRNVISFGVGWHERPLLF